MKILAFILLSLACTHSAFAQTPARDSVPYDNDSSFDVKYVKFDLSVRPDTEYLAGSVELRAQANVLRPDSTIQLSLRAQLSVDTILEDGNPTRFQHLGDKLFVTLDDAYAPGAPFELTIYYHGYSTEPDRVGFIHTWQKWYDPKLYGTPAGIPISWSWGEPYGMKDWWPCKDNPADKLDSADLYFTCPIPNMIASNGTLVSATVHDTMQTFHWHESYPIDHYLLAFVCTQYDTLVHWHHWADGDSTKIMHFVFPGSADTMGPQLILVDSILDVYERWFGPYAFRNEKYGIAQWHGGGMENQTLSFCNDDDSGLVAHETAHQWFGDAVTCKTWNDCWLNEGFATYVTDLFFRHAEGQAVFDTIIEQEEQNITSVPGGFVHTPDSLLVDSALNGRLVYDKGALVLHMLNFVLGSDTAFFRCIREYVTGPLRYGVASGRDFEHSVERSSGRDLKWFFDEWVYDAGYPIYTINWDAHDGEHPSVAIEQSGSTPDSPLFTMPIQLEFIGMNIDTTVEVWNEAPLQSYSFSFPDTVRRMVFDPHNWLLDGSVPRTLAVRPFASPVAAEFRIREQLNGYEADFSIEQTGPVSIGIYDVLGREVEQVPFGILEAGDHSEPFPLPVPLKAGTYFCRLMTSGSSTRSTTISILN